MRIDLDRRQTQELARLIVENSDRIVDGIYLLAQRDGVVRVEIRLGDGVVKGGYFLYAKGAS